MKVAPLYEKIGGLLVHTGQHYDPAMCDDLLAELGLKPTHRLSTTAVPEMVRGIEDIIRKNDVHRVIVYGDTDSTLAGAVAGHNRRNVSLVHVEAGLRSGDWSMPEERNRYIIDHLADKHFTTTMGAVNTLVSEGIPMYTANNVGNLMIDTLVKFLPHTGQCRKIGSYALMTLHRPSNVDDHTRLRSILRQVEQLPLPVVWVVHPRLQVSLCDHGNVTWIRPQSYLEFLSLEKCATVVITDSGGVQEETTYLGVPCLTLRPNTERPVTVTYGTNTLIEPDQLVEKVDQILAGRGKAAWPIPLWDGHTASRIAEALCVTH